MIPSSIFNTYLSLKTLNLIFYLLNSYYGALWGQHFTVSAIWLSCLKIWVSQLEIHSFLLHSSVWGESPTVLLILSAILSVSALENVLYTLCLLGVLCSTLMSRGSSQISKALCKTQACPKAPALSVVANSAPSLRCCAGSMLCSHHHSF